MPQGGRQQFGAGRGGYSGIPSSSRQIPSSSRQVSSSIQHQPSLIQRMAVKAPDPNFVADSPLKIKAGQNIEHDRFGFGVVVSVEGDPANLKAVVDFKVGGRKTLLLKFAKIRIVD